MILTPSDKKEDLDLILSSEIKLKGSTKGLLLF